MAAAHRATKPAQTTTFSASASKAHRGAATSQKAVDEGADEWAQPWQARERDTAEDVLSALEAMEHVRGAHEDIPLPDIDEERIYRVSGRFPGRTGVGTCGLRPRHLLLVVRAARAALAKIFKKIEARKRWPEALREVIEGALGKKVGGSRLVGLMSSAYRIWARLRHWDCRAILESRIARPFLTAAPKRGAERTAFEVTREAEVAAAQGKHTAATLLDIAKFYEVIGPEEFAVAARGLGVPHYPPPRQDSV